MKLFKLFLFVFFFITVKIPCDPIIINGNVTDLVFCSDVNSVRFVNEYGRQGSVHEIESQNYHAFEIIVKIDDGVFDKYCLLVAGHEITMLKSSLTNRAALQSVHVDYDSLIWTRDETSELMARFPKLKEAIDLKIEFIKKTLLERYPEYANYIPYNISFVINAHKLFGTDNYVIIQFDEGHTGLGGILYVLDSAGEIIVEKMLSEDISEASLSKAVILSEDKVLLFHSVRCSGWDTRISVERITDGETH